MHEMKKNFKKCNCTTKENEIKTAHYSFNILNELNRIQKSSDQFIPVFCHFSLCLSSAS